MRLNVAIRPAARTYEGAPADGSVWKGPEDCEYVARSGGWFSDPSGARPGFRGPGAGGLASSARCTRRVRDLGRSFLGHPLLFERLVLLLVLHVR